MSLLARLLRRTPPHTHQPAWILRGDVPPDWDAHILGCGTCGHVFDQAEGEALGIDVHDIDLPYVRIVERGWNGYLDSAAGRANVGRIRSNADGRLP